MSSVNELGVEAAHLRGPTALPEWGTSSGGVQGSQLLPARQLSSQRRLGVGSVLGPCQVHASPALLHKHRGLSLFLGAGTRVPAPGSHGVHGTGRWGVDVCLRELSPTLMGPEQKPAPLHKSHGRR